MIVTAAAVFIVGTALDIVSSLGLREANPLFRDCTGRFTPARNLIASGLMLITALAVAAVVKPQVQDAISYGLLLGGSLRAVVSLWNGYVRLLCRRANARLRAEMERERDTGGPV